MWLHCAMLTADYDERQECMRKARGPLWLQALARAYPAYEKIGNSRKDKR